MNEHTNYRLDKELRDILSRHSTFDVLAALVRTFRNRGNDPAAEKLQAVYDELVPKIPPS